MKTIKNLDDFLRILEEGLLIALVIVMVLLAFFQVLLRNVFSAGILWADVFLRHLVLWIGLLGAVLVTRERRHIKIDILNKTIPERTKPAVDLFIDIVSLVVSVLLTKASFTFVAMEKAGGAVLFLNVPTWVMELIIPVAFFLISFHFLLRIGTGVSIIVKGEGP
jgi:TRAP-type C4-dicarboxylate transport system permease small subunit